MRFFVLLVLLASLSLVFAREATVATCDTWSSISPQYAFEGAASTSVTIVPGLEPYQTVSTLQITGNILYDGSVIQGTFPVHVHMNACDDGDAGPHYMFDPDGPVDPENEIWMTFTNTPNSVVSNHEQKADADGFKSVVIHSSLDGNPKALCCDLRFSEIDLDDDDDDSDSSAGVLGSGLLPLVSLLVAFFTAKFF